MKRYVAGLLAALLLLIGTSAGAGQHHGWKTTSNVGLAVLAVSSLAVPTIERDWTGFRQTIYSGVAAEGATLVGKSLVREERPNHKDHNSFPSGHASLAFSAATALQRRYGWKFGVPAYAVATLTGVARVAARQHHWWDVAAGAAIGISAGMLLTHPPDSRVQVAPWVGDGGGGVAVALVF